MIRMEQLQISGFTPTFAPTRGGEGFAPAGKGYDLLLKGGEFLDPGSGRRGRLDVAFADGKVAAIDADIPPALAQAVESAAGAIVVPGLIDDHVHAADGIGEAASPDVIGVGRGATTVADAGTCGASNFGAFRPVHVVRCLP